MEFNTLIRTIYRLLFNWHTLCLQVDSGLGHGLEPSLSSKLQDIKTATKKLLTEPIGGFKWS